MKAKVKADFCNAVADVLRRLPGLLESLSHAIDLCMTIHLKVIFKKIVYRPSPASANYNYYVKKQSRDMKIIPCIGNSVIWCSAVTHL